MNLLENMIYPMTKDLHIVQGSYEHGIDLHEDLETGQTKEPDGKPFTGASILMEQYICYIKTVRYGHLHCFNGNPSSATIAIDLTNDGMDIQRYYWLEAFPADPYFHYKYPCYLGYENFKMVEENAYFKIKSIKHSTINFSVYTKFCSNNGIDLNNITDQDVQLINMKFAK